MFHLQKYYFSLKKTGKGADFLLSICYNRNVTLNQNAYEAEE